MQITIEGMPEIMAKLDSLDNGIRASMRRALHRIGGLWKRTAVDYAPISPSTSMLKKLKKGGGSTVVKGRHGRAGGQVYLTQFYSDRLEMLLGQAKSKTRPMPGGLRRSIKVQSDDRHVEVFVPSNSPGGSYAVKMHDEKGRTWKQRGPGTQAAGAQADDKFITRAANDKKSDFLAIMESEINKILEGGAT